MEDKIAKVLGGEGDYWASPTTQVFAFIGLLWVSVKIFSFWRMVASLFVLPGKSLSKFGPKGSWALITGASDGIGKEYAIQLASKGYNIVLVSRTQSKLLELSKDLQSKYNISVRNHAMDFAMNREKDYVSLQKIVDEVENISILINNVGLSHALPVPFAETPDQELRDIITINDIATLRVTQIVTPGMIKRRRGLILTMASFGGLLPTPLLATYSGSKAFLQQWSSALSSELASHGITVQLVHSYLVVSAMSKIKRASLLVPTPRTFVKAALSKIGRSGGAQGLVGTSTPYWAHAFMQWGIALVQEVLPGGNAVVVWVNRRMHQDIRKRALRKAEREKKGS